MKSFKEYLTEEEKKRNRLRDTVATAILGSQIANVGPGIVQATRDFYFPPEHVQMAQIEKKYEHLITTHPETGVRNFEVMNIPSSKDRKKYLELHRMLASK